MFHVKHSTLLGAIALAASVMAGCAQTPDGQASTTKKKAAVKEFQRAVPVNEPILLDNFFFANAQCQAIDFTLQVTKKPQNGTAQVKPSTIKLEASRVKVGKPNPTCMGQVIASKELVYQPYSGYTGRDILEATFTNSRNPALSKTVRYLLTVQ